MDNAAQIYQIISIVSFSLAGVCFVLALFFFLKFRVIKIINDLSGRTAKKSIAEKRSENEKSIDKTFQINRNTKERKSVVVKNDAGTMVLPKSDITEPLTNNDQTDLLEAGTAILIKSEDVSDAEDSTTVLSGNASTKKTADDVQLDMIQSIVLIHTNEII